MEWIAKSLLQIPLKLLKRNSSNNGDKVDYWIKVFLKMAMRFLSWRQKLILIEIYKHSKHIDLTITAFARYLASKYNMPLSTAKWNLRSLRDLELIEGGNYNVHGIPLKLTRAGKIIAEELNKIRSFFK